jgi:hypothetical protein
LVDLLSVLDKDAIVQESRAYQTLLLFVNFPGSLIKSSITHRSCAVTYNNCACLLHYFIPVEVLCSNSFTITTGCSVSSGLDELELQQFFYYYYLLQVAAQAPAFMRLSGSSSFIITTGCSSSSSLYELELQCQETTWTTLCLLPYNGLSSALTLIVKFTYFLCKIWLVIQLCLKHLLIFFRMRKFRMT